MLTLSPNAQVSLSSPLPSKGNKLCGDWRKCLRRRHHHHYPDFHNKQSRGGPALHPSWVSIVVLDHPSIPGRKSRQSFLVLAKKMKLSDPPSSAHLLLSYPTKEVMEIFYWKADQSNCTWINFHERFTYTTTALHKYSDERTMTHTQTYKTK